MRNYLFSFDVEDGRFSNATVLAFISENKYVESWANPFQGSFLLKSDYDLRTVRKSISTLLRGVGHLIGEVQIETVGGSLPNSMWDWFNRGTMSETELLEVRKAREERFIEQFGHSNFKED